MTNTPHEAVAEAIKTGRPLGAEMSRQQAEAAIAADRKALRDAGYVVAPVVKMSRWDLIDSIVEITSESSALDFVEYLQSLGLPIELETEK